MLHSRLFWAALGAVLATALGLLAGPFSHVLAVREPALPASSECTLLTPSSATPTAPCPNQITLLPGMQVSRQVGPVRFALRVDATLARVDAEVFVGDAGLSGLSMTPDAPTAGFDLRSAGVRVKGSLGSFFCAPPRDSHLIVDFTLDPTPDNTRPLAFRGDLIRWQSPTTSVLARYRQALLPDLQVEVDLLDPHEVGSTNPQTAQVSFFYANDLLDRYTLIASTTEVTLRQSSMGPVSIEGGSLFMRVATSQQQGQVSLDGVFRSGQNPPNHYNASIAQWPWVGGRADNCRGQI